MAQVTSGHVIVHPIFSFHPERRKPATHKFPVKVPLNGSSKLEDWAKSNTILGRDIRTLIKAFQNYCKEIDGISKIPNTPVLILKAHGFDTYNSSERRALATDAGILPSDVDKLLDRVSKLQQALINYATEKLGNRVTETKLDPEDIGPLAKEVFNSIPKKSRVEIFGETLGCCVDLASEALTKLKIPNIIATQKCPK